MPFCSISAQLDLMSTAVRSSCCLVPLENVMTGVIQVRDVHRLDRRPAPFTQFQRFAVTASNSHG